MFTGAEWSGRLSSDHPLLLAQRNTRSHSVAAGASRA